MFIMKECRRAGCFCYSATVSSFAVRRSEHALLMRSEQRQQKAHMVDTGL